MADIAEARQVALPAVVDLDALDTVRDRLIDDVLIRHLRDWWTWLV